MGAAKPVLILICGINGAGKTTFYYQRAKPLLDKSEREYPFVNADEMEQAQFPNEVGKHSLEMGKLVAEIRAQYIKAGQSFVTETVFSHESKNQLVKDAQQAGFEVVLNHIHVYPAELACKRVRDRVGSGGHDVRKDTILSRYSRTVTHIQEASKVADVTYVWDNSRQSCHSGIIYRLVMTLDQGKVTQLADPIPDWASKMYRLQIKNHRGK